MSDSIPFISNSHDTLILNENFFYLIYCMPLLYALGVRPLWLVVLVILVLSFGVGFPSNLAAIGLTCIAFSLLLARRLLLLSCGFILVILSSAPLIQFLLLFVFFGMRGSANLGKAALAISATFRMSGS